MAKITLLFILCLLPLCAQEQQNAADLPTGFSSITLGLTFEQVSEALKNDGNFNYRGQPDVTMRESPDRSVIETAGMTFISRAFFSFADDKLYAITLMMNPERLDYFTLFTRLQAQYGAVTDLSPVRAFWANDTVQLSLERPLIIKYLDLGVFNELRENSATNRSARIMSRDDFLDTL